MQTLHSLELVYCKNYIISQNICFQVIQNSLKKVQAVIPTANSLGKIHLIYWTTLMYFPLYSQKTAFLMLLFP